MLTLQGTQRVRDNLVRVARSFLFFLLPYLLVLLRHGLLIFPVQSWQEKHKCGINYA